MNLLRYFCEEIEADFLERGIDIHDWWCRTRDSSGRPVLSSRRLLVLAFQLNDDSAFKAEWRQDWSPEQYLQAAQLNEIRAMRAENAVYSGREWNEPSYLKSPRQEEADRMSDEFRDSIRSGIRAQLYSKLIKEE